MAQASIFGGIYSSAGMGEPTDYTGITRPRYGASGSGGMMFPVQPNTWVPLNPGIARRYYDMFYRSWVVRTCFQEKLKAGFSGGFGYQYGPKKNKSRGGKNGDSTPVITEGPELAWIEETLSKGAMYHDILGIVAFRRKVHPRTKTVRIEVVDLPKGYFVGKIDERGNQEYGWVFNKTVDTIALGGRRPNPAEARSGSSVLHEPDPEVYVYAWPTLEPDIGAAAPFKSILATIFLNLLETAEMWQNEIEAHYQITHPTWVTEPDIKTRGPADTLEHDLMLSVTGQLGPTESVEYFERSRLNAEVSIHMANNLRKMNDANVTTTQRRLGLKMDNTETVHTRLHAWQSNHYICPVGTKVGKGPEAKLRSDFVNILNLKATQVAAVFGVPIPFLAGSRSGSSSSKTTLGTRIEGATFRNTLVQMRHKITAFFEEAYMIAIGSLENSILANMLGDLGQEGSETEKIVRMYVKEILTPGGRYVLDDALGTKGHYEPRATELEEAGVVPPSGGGGEENGSKRKKPKRSSSRRALKTGSTTMVGEGGDTRKIGAELEAEDIRKKMEERKLFTTPDAVIQSQRIDRAGNVIVGDSTPAEGGPEIRRTSTIKKRVLGKMTQSKGTTEYARAKRLEKRKRDSDGADPIQMALEQWKGPHLRGQDALLFEGYQREIADFIDEQKYLDKLEEARWQKFMEKSNLMDRRVSRIMVMALQNFGVALNPTKIQAAIRREMEADPRLDNAEHRKLSSGVSGGIENGISSTSGKDPLETMENVFVNEIIGHRKKYLNRLVDETHRLTIVWNSAPLPDVELLIQASKEGLGIPSELVGMIVAGELGLEEIREKFIKREEVDDKRIENYLKRKNLTVKSKTTQEERKPGGVEVNDSNKRAKTSTKDSSIEDSSTRDSGTKNSSTSDSSTKDDTSKSKRHSGNEGSGGKGKGGKKKS